MLPHRGTASRGWSETLALGRDLAALAPVARSRSTAGVALLLDWESWWGLELDEHPSARLRMKDLLLRWYRPLWEANIAVDLAHPDGDLDSYRVVLAPSLHLLRDATAEKLVGHVERGGHLVVGPFSGVVDQDDRVHPGALCRPLAHLLGVEIDEWAPLPDGRIAALDCDGQPGSAELWSEWLDTTTAQAWARFTDGPLRSRPAITRRPHGAGTAWYAGCVPDRATMRTLVATVVGRAGVRPVLTAPGVEATMREHAGERFLFLLNHDDSPTEVPLPSTGTDLLDADGSPRQVVTLAAGRAAVIRLDPPASG